MAPGYAPMSGGYPDRPQHGPDVVRPGYAAPGDSANRGQNTSGGSMDPASGGWYHGGHRPHYAPENNYSSFHPVAMPIPQSSGMPPPQAGMPPPQNSIPPQTALPSATLQPQTSMPQPSSMPPQNSMQLQSGMLPPQQGIPQPPLGGMPPPQAVMSPVHGGGMAGMQTQPQGMMQPMQPPMQHPVAAMQPQQRLMPSAPMVLKPLPQPVPQPQGGMPHMTSGTGMQGEDGSGYMAPRMNHAGQGQMASPAVQSRQPHHPMHVHSHDSSHPHSYQSSQPQGLQPPMQSHQPSHPSNSTYMSSPLHPQKHSTTPHGYAGQHEAASAPAAHHSYPPQHQAPHYPEQHAPIQAPEQAVPRSSGPPQPQSSASRTGGAPQPAAAAKGGVSVDAGGSVCSFSAFVRVI